ncbi:hypothetical protein IJT17_07185, partial [bacterium]|nr:hypothetical protein [bacterium]
GILGGILSVALWAVPLQAETGWQTLVPPDTGGGLVLSPHMCGASGSRPFLAWAGTGANASYSLPEFTFSVLRGKEWSAAKAPFFGDMINNVRCLAVGMARYTVGAVYMRNTDQSKTTFEVLFTGSNDKGWSFSKPSVADSFNHEDSGGTAVAIAGVGGKKPMFMLGWLSEARTVKAAIWNPHEKIDRPRAENIGKYGRGFERLQLCGENKSGFLAAWNDGHSLMTASLSPLVGKLDSSESLISAKIGYNFALTDYKGRDPKLVVELPKLRKGEGARRQVYAWKDGKWERLPAAPPSKGERPCPARLEACQDDHGRLHVISLAKNGEDVLYSCLEDGKFSEPEKVMELRKVIGLTGLDIAYAEDHVYVTASQGPYMSISCRKVN